MLCFHGKPLSPKKIFSHSKLTFYVDRADYLYESLFYITTVLFDNNILFDHKKTIVNHVRSMTDMRNSKHESVLVLVCSGCAD